MEKKSLIIGIAAITVAATAGGLLFVDMANRNKVNDEMKITDNASSTTAENAEDQNEEVEPAPVQWQPGSVMIDFAVCQPQIQMIEVSFGSAVYEIKGLNGDMCEMNYGGEVENPNWDRSLSTKCQVPVSLGQTGFNKTEYGIDFSPIKKYCVKK